MSAVHVTRAEVGDPASEAALAHQCLHYMLLMRELEDRIERKLYRQGKIVGGVYVGRGQEAIPVGTGLLAGPDDVLLPSHRDLAVYLIRGISPGRILAQYMGRMGGLTRGRDGNMHMGDMKHGLVAIISALAATVPVAAGVALALRYQGKNGVAFSYFGDGATSRGDWHEGVNFATVQKLPVVFICNNNQYAYSTPLGLQMACANVADRGAAYDMPAEIVDGNDVLAVYQATQRAVEHARAGKGPLPDGVQDLPHDRPLGARCRPLRAAGISCEEWGKARPHHAPGSPHDSPRVGPSGPEIERRARRRAQGSGRSRGIGRAQSVPRPRHPARRRLRDPIAMPTTYLEAIREGLWEEMERDPNVFLMGEDIGVYGGAFKVTDGFFEHFGEQRVVDTPISEAAIVGAAIGASLHGAAAGGRDAVRRFHHLRVRPDRQLRRQMPLPLERGRAHRGARAFGRRHPRRPVPLAESRRCGSCARPA